MIMLRNRRNATRASLTDTLQTGTEESVKVSIKSRNLVNLFMLKQIQMEEHQFSMHILMRLPKSKKNMLMHLLMISCGLFFKRRKKVFQIM